MGFSFQNDPILAPGDRAIVAKRDAAGEAYGWDPATGRLTDLVDFLGEPYVLIGDTLYCRQPNGDLTVAYLGKQPQVFVKWLNATPTGHGVAEFTQGFASVVGADASADLELAAQLDATGTELVEALGTIADLRAELADARETIAVFEDIPTVEAIANALKADAAPAKAKGSTKKQG